MCEKLSYYQGSFFVHEIHRRLRLCERWRERQREGVPKIIKNDMDQKIIPYDRVDYRKGRTPTPPTFTRRKSAWRFKKNVCLLYYILVQISRITEIKAAI
jgi:hypothetical protein